MPASPITSAREQLLGVTQIHGADVATILRTLAPRPKARAPTPWSQPFPASPSASSLPTAPPSSSTTRIHNIIGAVHAGWKGALAGVLEATVAAMQALGATNITAAIGPCIHQSSYEVGADLRDAILAHDPTHASFFTAGRPGPRLEPHWQFDLPGYCADRLRALGTVDIIQADTLSDETRFFSHRRRTLAGGGPIGHQLSAILLTP